MPNVRTTSVNGSKIIRLAGYGARNENFVLVLPNSDLSDLAPVGCVATSDAPCSIDDWCVEERNAPYAGMSRAQPLAKLDSHCNISPKPNDR